MTLKDIPRQTLLKVVAGAAGGLLLLDYVVIEPAFRAWGEQSARIEALQKKVDNGKKLLARETIIRDRWAEMGHANLPADDSEAGSEIINALNHWKLASGVGLPSVAPGRTAHDDLGFDEFEYRVSATGDETALGRFIYELETDPIPVALEECEIAARDNKGQQLTLTARFSFARILPDASGGSNAGRSAR